MVEIPTDRLAPFVVGEGRTGVLLVHGFTGTPFEMRELTCFLAERGFRAANIRLAGHARGEAALARTTWPDWWESVVDGYVSLASECDRVFVCGLSMGGLLALKLAAHYPLAGAAIFVAPLFVRHPLTRLVPLLKHLVTYRPQGTSNILDPEALAETPDTGRAPMHAIESLMQLMRNVDRLLPSIRCPLLLIYSRLDTTVPHDNLAHLQQRIGSTDVRAVTLERSGHVVTVDYDRDIVGEETASFFDRLDF